MYGNLYFVGTVPASTHVIKTGEGLVMLDCGYQESLYLVLENMRRVGLDPADLKALFLTHGHIDHCGAAAALREYTGCRIYLGAPDLTYVDNSSGNTDLSYDVEMGMKLVPFTPDVLTHDGDVFRFGATEIRCVATPGHTPGAMSFFFPVTEGEKTVTAGLHGGMGINTLSADYLRRYGLPVSLREDFVRSMERLKKENVDLFLGNHAEHNHTVKKAELLRAGKTEAFVDPSEWSPYAGWCIENLMNLIAKERKEGKTE